MRRGLTSSSFLWAVLLAFQTTITSNAFSFHHSPPKIISGVPVQQTPLRWNDVHSPWCYVASPYNDVDEFIPPPTNNFLATQVWPSARGASMSLEKYYSSSIKTMCEFGCGPGLPSLVGYILGIPHVVATDVDPLALQLVQAASSEQKSSFKTNRLSIQFFDLLSFDPIPKADLYILSDVFESTCVARGAARVTSRILSQQFGTVWVFAQSDRAQRDVYLNELQSFLENEIIGTDQLLRWTPLEEGPPSSSSIWDGRLWLCDVDETKVDY